MSRLSVLLILVITVCAASLAATDSQAAPDRQFSVVRTVQANSALAYQRQVQFYQNKLEANPHDAVAHNLLGMSYQGLERIEDAMKEYRQATKLNPRYAEAWNNLGSAYHMKNNLKQAAKQYRKAIELKPELASAYRNLGTALLAMKKIDQGLEAYRRAYEVDPAIFSASGSSSAVRDMDSGMQYFCFAKVSAAGGRIEAALDFLQKARNAGFRDFKRVEKDSDFANVIITERYENVKQGVSTLAQSEPR
jgi:tetratricopeptide (TPR) repeat protein